MPELVAPDVRFRRSFAAAIEEFRAEGRGSKADRSVLGDYARTPDSTWASDEAFAAFTATIRAEALPETPRPEGRVPDTELWWAEGDEYLGRIAIRHRLTPSLLEVGGHIGYDVRPAARRRGYATEMLRQGLAIAKELGIDSALVTCDIDNIGSRTVIERNGGVLEDERNGKRRYWIDTTPRLEHLYETDRGLVDSERWWTTPRTSSPRTSTMPTSSSRARSGLGRSTSTSGSRRSRPTSGSC